MHTGSPRRMPRGRLVNSCQRHPPVNLQEHVSSEGHCHSTQSELNMLSVDASVQLTGHFLAFFFGCGSSLPSPEASCNNACIKLGYWTICGLPEISANAFLLLVSCSRIFWYKSFS